MADPVNAPTVGDGTAWHALSTKEVTSRLATGTEKGLATAEASSRLQKYGANRLPEGKKRGAFARFFSQLNNILVHVLLGAGFVKLMLGLGLDARIIIGVVILNALLGFIQEGKAEKALDSIRNMLSAEARTTRGGETRTIPAEELVPGDVVLLESGDKVPADLRLAEAKNLRTEEAALTGESVQVGDRDVGHRWRTRCAGRASEYVMLPDQGPDRSTHLMRFGKAQAFVAGCLRDVGGAAQFSPTHLLTRNILEPANGL